MANPPVCTITAAGIARPTFEECLAYYVDGYRGIYGSDVVLDVDTQDGQWVRLQADALHAANGVTVAVYNAFAPSSAQGVNLARLVKLNGLTKKTASRSSVDLRVVGVAGTVIEAGVAADEAGNLWDLPATVRIPFVGEITVTAIAREAGAIAAPAGSVTTISQTVLGWQEVSNPEPAIPGAPIEDDVQLKRRQAVSTTKPAMTIIEGIAAEVGNLSGVVRVKPYENATRNEDANGLPPGSFALVVEGGDVDAIASAIGTKKAPGGILSGTSTGLYVDGAGIRRELPFYRPHLVTMTYRVQLRKRAGYTADVGDRIAEALAAWTNAREIGGRIVRARAYLPAQLYGGQGAATYELVAVLVARDGGLPGEADIQLAFDEAATCTADGIDVEVLP